ncbi:MAG: hypothetical protein LBS18_05145 [Clostridiales bacterium]|nr:hypothetical protein [Clostridiales bacterium]
MFKIDRLSAGDPDGDHSGVIIKRWVKVAQQDAARVPPIADPPQAEAETAAAAPEEIAVNEESFESSNSGVSPDLEQLAIRHAAALIDEAQDAADELIEQANKEADAIRDAAYQDGYAKGMEEAGAHEAKRAAEAREWYGRALAAIKERENERDLAIGDHVLQLSVEIAEKIVNIELEKSDKVFMGLIKEAIARLNSKEKFAIHVNAREYGRLFSEGSGWLAEAMQTAPFTVVEDELVPPGGLTLYGQGGEVQAGIDCQLAEVKRALDAGVSQHGAEL